MNRQKILIYLDDGVSAEARQIVPRAIEDEVACGYVVSTVRAVDIASSYNWASDTKALVVPGGRDLEYLRKLKGAPCASIRRYVEEGGVYLGLCAGAYFASAVCEFDQGGALEVVGERELAFFNGRAVGPAFGPGTYEYGSDRFARVTPIELGGRTVHSYFNGGCHFADAETIEGVEVVARYLELPNTPAAIVRTFVGHGAAVLSGVHPEYSPELAAECGISEPLVASLRENSENRRFLFRHLLMLAGLALKD